MSLALPCNTDSSVPGFNNLKELDNFVFNEFLLVLQGEPIRPPPYVYYLCPDTVYDVSAEGTFLFPYLDETYFICGLDGASDNNCIIKGGTLQVLIREIFELEDSIPNYVHENTYFFGVTFEESSISSIYAIDAVGTSVYFVRCVWKSGSGFSLIEAVFIDFSELTPTPTPAPTDEVSDFPSLSPSGVPSGVLSDMPSKSPSFSDDSIGERLLQETSFEVTGMNVTLVDCSIVESGPVSDSDPFYAILMISARLVTFNTEFNFNSGTSAITSSDSKINIHDSYFNFNAMEFVVLILGSHTNIHWTEFSGNGGVAMFGGATLNYALLDSTKFNNNFVSLSSVLLEGGSLDGSFLTFENTWGPADVSSKFGGTLSLSDSCFFNGNYSIAPVVVDVNSTLKLNGGNFADELISQGDDVPGQCISPPGALFEFGRSDCFNEEVICSGECKLFGGVDCVAPDTKAPTASPTNAPSPMPSSSLPPTASPVTPYDRGIIQSDTSGAWQRIVLNSYFVVVFWSFVGYVLE